MKDLKETVRALPHRPGVYLFKDKDAGVLYIGKAADLRKRVASYLTQRWNSPKLEAMTGKIASVDCVETPTEVEALLLEAHLVKELEPRYNTMLRDDKSYPLLKISGERFPRLSLARRQPGHPLKAGRLASPRRSTDRRWGRRGQDRRASYYGPFTDAKLLREAIRIINTIFPLRKCQPLPKRECLYYHLHQCLAPCIKPDVKPEYDRVVGEVKRFLAGGKKSLIEYLTERMEEAAGELRFEDAQMFKEQLDALSRLRRRRFHPAQPPGRAVALSATQELKSVFRLKRLPERIVCFDVSNVQGAYATASRVSFYRELPDKNEYRRYRIRTVRGIDDYAMIREVVTRMICGLREGREAFDPDLLLIDGGRGHLSSALRAMKAEGYEGPLVVAIAKRFEHLYTSHSPGPVVLERDSSALRLLIRVRDEAHRFAVSYHRLLRSKGLQASLLDHIPGVGEERKRQLLRAFGSVEAIRDAEPAVLARLHGMNAAIAHRVSSYLARASGSAA